MVTAQSEKKKSKESIQGEFYLPKDAPLLVVIVDSAGAKKELKKLTAGLKTLPLNFRILFIDGKAEATIGLGNSYRVTKKEAEKFFTFAHMALFPSKKPSKTLVMSAINNDTVPIASTQVNYLKNYTGPTEEGNSFKFQETGAWGMYAAVVRALENFGFPYDWKNIIKSAREVL